MWEALHFPGHREMDKEMEKGEETKNPVLIVHNDATAELQPRPKSNAK